MRHLPVTDQAPAAFLTRQEIALIVITMVWGGTFLVVHLAMAHSGPLFFVGLRFTAAAAVTLLLLRPAMAGLTRTELLAGAAVGASIFLGYALQTVGLQTITASQSAFLTALYVPMVPLMQLAVFRNPPPVMGWVGIGLAFSGLVLLAGPGAGRLSLDRGEVVTLLGAAAIAAEILLIGRYAAGVDSRRFTVVQLAVAGVLSLALMPVAGEAVLAFSWVWLVAALGLGAASALIQLTINWAQKTVSPLRATVIYAGEPVWGGVIGRLAGDRLPALALLGAALIVAGVLVSDWRPGRGKRPGCPPHGV
ncbi:MAG: DMT family transporter [Mangrovicoccus sp.]|nr:DMT family transporter [Mangrovicoccus sp.]